MRKRARHLEEEPGIDLTPMLDVVFIMLIFFIVTTSFVKEAGVEINRPTASTAQKKENASILIAITEVGEVWLDKRKVDVRSVRANVERMRAEAPEGSVVIQADKASKTGVLVQVMDQVRLAGVTNISIAGSNSNN
jgi:biopolymer transport protein ExbD